MEKSPLSPSEEHYTCREGFGTQTATSQLSWPPLSAWCEAREPGDQRTFRPQQRLKQVNISLQPAARLSLVGVQLPTDGVRPAELLLQLAGALHVHGVALLKEAHLPA